MYHTLTDQHIQYDCTSTQMDAPLSKEARPTSSGHASWGRSHLVVTDVEIDIEGLPRAASLQREGVAVEGAVHAHS